MVTQRAFLFLFISFFVNTAVVTADKFCCLCNGCSILPSSRQNLFVDQSGKTCTKLFLEMADPDNASTPGSALCKQLQNQFRDRCCNLNHTPRPIVQTSNPLNEDGKNYPSGTYRRCNICSGGKYPGKPFTVVAVSNGQQQISGIKTCKDLYWWGRKGLLEDRICGPAQHYFKDKCDCAGGTSPGIGGNGATALGGLFGSLFNK